jgi:hypothetical protein
MQVQPITLIIITIVAQFDSYNHAVSILNVIHELHHLKLSSYSLHVHPN